MASTRRGSRKLEGVSCKGQVGRSNLTAGFEGRFDGGGLHVTVCALMVSSDDLNLVTENLKLET